MKVLFASFLVDRRARELSLYALFFGGVQPALKDFSRQCVAVNVKQLRRLALIFRPSAVIASQILPFVFKTDSALHHFLDEGFQSIFQQRCHHKSRELFSQGDNAYWGGVEATRSQGFQKEIRCKRVGMWIKQ